MEGLKGEQCAAVRNPRPEEDQQTSGGPRALKNVTELCLRNTDSAGTWGEEGREARRLPSSRPSEHSDRTPIRLFTSCYYADGYIYRTLPTQTYRTNRRARLFISRGEICKCFTETTELRIRAVLVHMLRCAPCNSGLYVNVHCPYTVWQDLKAPQEAIRTNFPCRQGNSTDVAAHI